MPSHGPHSPQYPSVEQRNPPCGGAVKALTGALQLACKRRKLPETLAATSVCQDWTWEPIRPTELGNAFESFNSIVSVLTEAQQVLAYERSQGGNQATYSLAKRELDLLHHKLTQNFLEHLSQVRDPLGVLISLLHHPEIRATSACVSAILGVRDEKEGGDERRHSEVDRKSFYARGGYMYQASDLYELRCIFSALALKEGITFYDLGSGYGHVLFCGAASRRDITFKGIELMSSRVAECNDAKNRLGLMNLSFTASDVTTGGFSDADVIFLFNPFPPDTQGEVTELIHQLALMKPLAILDYGGFVTQRLTSVVPIVGPDIAPYRLVASRKFLKEACELVGMPVPRGTSARNNSGRSL